MNSIYEELCNFTDEKNIYENVNINFHNTLKMVNENDPNNIIFNQIGSNRLNISSSNTIDYDNAKVSKIRINYVDETTNYNLSDWLMIRGRELCACNVNSSSYINSLTSYKSYSIY